MMKILQIQKKFLKNISVKLKKKKLFQQKKTRALVCNLGIRKSNGKFIAILYSDDLWIKIKF